MAQNGICTLRLGDNNFLTDHNGNATVGLGAETPWIVRVIEENGTPQATFILILKADGPERALTLSPESSGDWTDITVSDLQSPSSRLQHWMMADDSITLLRFPPIVIGNIQSVAEPTLYVGMAGAAALPRTHMNVGATAERSDEGKWKIDYIEMQ